MTARRIQPLPIPTSLDVATDFGPPPRVADVAPTDLFVDETYQRDVTERSGALIRSILKKFRWSRYKPPIAVEVEGQLHVVDGQHTAIVCATLNIPLIKVVIVEGAALDERARAFVGHNTDRVIVTPYNIYRALVAAGDPDALEVDSVCKRAGVTVKQLSSLDPNLRGGDTAAIGTIRRLVATRGIMRARQVLETLVRAKRVPITAAEITAAAQVLCVGQPQLDIERLARVIRIGGDDALSKARSHAAAQKVPLWKVLSESWSGHLVGDR